MVTITLRELEEDLAREGIPKEYALGIIQAHGDKTKKTIDWSVAEKTIKELKEAQQTYGRYRPKTIAEDMVFTPEELLYYVDFQYTYLKEKYKPYGLKVPFSTWGEARAWLRKESSVGVLATPRIKIMYGDEELWEADLGGVYKASPLCLPYERLGNGINDLICNSSPFLRELRGVIKTLHEYTGLDSIDLLHYFFCGTKPKFTRISVLKYEFFNTFFSIQINSIDVTREEWLKVYDLYRKEVKQKHEKRLSPRMKRFSSIVDVANIPNKPKKNFCEPLRHKWNEMTGENISDWRVIRRMCERLKKKGGNILLNSHFKDFVAKREVD
ncbi:MAG: hypothetical protein ACOX2N_04485 [Peptococcia bacterium]